MRKIRYTQSMENTYSLFLVVIPGLEQLAYDELILKSNFFDTNYKTSRIVHGGIEIETTNIRDIAFFHIYLKIPTRILLRISHFRAKDFPKLFKNLLKIDWAEYIPWVIPNLQFSSSESKLFDERKILKTLHDSINGQIKAQQPKEKYKDLKWSELPTVYIRNEDDNITVSIDLTGERMDRRGKKLFTTKAPMRESIASAMIQLTINSVESSQIETATIFDPMAGSGTIIFEASEYFSENKRHFNFLEMPFFFKGQPSVKFLAKNTLPKFRQFIANDIESEAIAALKKNLENYEGIQVDVFQSDFLASELQLPKSEKLFILTNPPYNKRIKTDLAMKDFLNLLYQQALTYRVDQISIITPMENHSPKMDGYSKKEYLNILNGGLRTKFINHRLN